MTCRHDVITRLGFKIQSFIPVDCHVLDELEGIHVLCVMLREVGGHLQGRVEGHIKAQLVANGNLHLFAPGYDLAHIGLEDTRGVVHWAALQTRERQNGGMSGLNALTELGAHSAFITNHVGPSAAETGRPYSLM